MNLKAGLVDYNVRYKCNTKPWLYCSDTKHI